MIKHKLYNIILEYQNDYVNHLRTKRDDTNVFGELKTN